MQIYSFDCAAPNPQRYISFIDHVLASSLDKNKPYAIFDFPNHSNVGDSAIWQGELKALFNYFGRHPVLTCHLLPFSARLPHLKKNTQIIIHGGGNLGDLWPWFQMFRERIIVTYPDNRIVQMPQSIYFQEQCKMDQCSKVFSSHKDLLLMVRDWESYQIGMLLNNENVVMVPDMALALGAIERQTKPIYPILCLLRCDHEKAIDLHQIATDKPSITDWTNEPRYAESIALLWTDRIERKIPPLRSPFVPLSRYLHNRISRLRLARGCDLLSLGHVVVTDRLHAHILCTLMSIPHVVLDNSYGKISRFRNAWKTGEPHMCTVASGFSEALAKAEILYDSIKESS
jgi:exopolysaccharide biosynthesis predicted pyruvyltransferase EpsI